MVDSMLAQPVLCSIQLVALSEVASGVIFSTFMRQIVISNAAKFGFPWLHHSQNIHLGGKTSNLCVAWKTDDDFGRLCRPEVAMSWKHFAFANEAIHLHSLWRRTFH